MRTRGLTLVELLAALAITGLLVAVSLRAVGSLQRCDDVRQAQFDATSRRTCLERVLRMDIAHAKKLRIVDGGFELQTWVALDAETLTSTHLSVTVGYAIETIHDRPWLIRRQGSPGAEPALVELLLPDVAAIEVTSEGSSQPPARDRWTSVSSLINVSVRFDGDDPATETFTFLTD